jgi:hypothetical protein
MKTQVRDQIRERANKLKKSIPKSSGKFRRKLVAHAHEISQTRTGSPEFNDLVVCSVIRGSIKKIRDSVNSSDDISSLFRPERVVETKYPIKPIPDPRSVLLPNEMWAGKGSGGKTNFSAI